MALHGSGPIWMSQIQAEFGGPNYWLSTYYRNGGYVDDKEVSVPYGGAIWMSQFYGTSNVVAGSRRFDNNGSMVLPPFNYFRITCMGAGGGGGGYRWNGSANSPSHGDGKAGGDSYAGFNGGGAQLRGNGGAGGIGISYPTWSNTANGAHGTGSGGDSNSTGGGANGGVGVIMTVSGVGNVEAGDGGDGGRAIQTWNYTQIGQGTTINCYAGNGGAAGSTSYWAGARPRVQTAGSNGYVLVEWW